MAKESAEPGGFFLEAEEVRGPSYSSGVEATPGCQDGLELGDRQIGVDHKGGILIDKLQEGSQRVTPRVKRIKVLVADDQTLLRDLMVSQLKRHADIQVIGEALSGAETLTKVAELRPDVVLLDIHLGDMDGLDVTQAIKEHSSGTKVVLLTGFHNEEYIYRAFKMGASGYLSKDSSMDEVLNAVREAHRAESLLDPDATMKLLREFEIRKSKGTPSEEPQKSDGLERLTSREHEILGLIADGQSNQQIADHLFISEYTVKTHISNLFRKLGISDRVQAVLWALEHGVR